VTDPESIAAPPGLGNSPAAKVTVEPTAAVALLDVNTVVVGTGAAPDDHS
jgi:hypothetical protein